MNETDLLANKFNNLSRGFAALGLALTLFIPILGLMINGGSVAFSVISFLKSKDNKTLHYDTLRSLIFSCVCITISLFLFCAAIIINLRNNALV